MDLLAHYNDDSLNIDDSPSSNNEKEKAKVEDSSLEDEWLSFEKMISSGQSEPSSQYLVGGMVAYPGLSLASKQITSAPEVEETEEPDDCSEEEADKGSDKDEDDDEDDAFFKMRKKVKERDRSSSSDRSSKSSRSSRSRSLSPPQLSPVDSVNSQDSLEPPDLFDPTDDMHYKSPRSSPERSPEVKQVKVEEEEEHNDQQQPQSEQDASTEDREVKKRSKSRERKPSTATEGKSSRRDSHRSRSRSKHRDKESSKRHRSRSRSKGRHHRHSSKDRHRHRRPRHRSRDRKHSRSKEKRSKSHEKKTEEKVSKHRSRSKERKRSSRERKRSRSKGKDKKRSERDRKRSRSKERRRGKSRRDRSADRKKRRSRSRSKSRDRKRKYSRSRSRSREQLRSRSPFSGKKMTFKEVMRKEILTAGKKVDEGASESSSIPMNKPGEILKASAMLASIKSTNSTVTPQMALLQTMAAMHQKAQEITGVAVPKYYNPAAVNPLKYAEQVQKRKLLWSKNKQDDKDKEKEEQMEVQWKSTQFAADQDGKMTSKFRKLMGIKDVSESEEGVQVELSEEQKRKQDELFSRLDKEYEFARMATHTHRGVGLGFSAQVQFPSTQPPH